MISVHEFSKSIQRTRFFRWKLAVVVFLMVTVVLCFNPINGYFLLTDADDKATRIAIGVQGLPSLAGVGDFNGDHHPDVLLVGSGADDGHQVDFWSVRFGDGKGGFVLESEFRTMADATSLAIGDFTGDGKDDYAVTYTTTLFLAIHASNGEGIFPFLNGVELDSFPVGLGTADFNQDQKLDLVVLEAGFGAGSNVAILLGNGDGGFQNPQRIAVGRGSRSLVIADINGDQHPDIATANAGSNDVSLLINTTIQPAARTLVFDQTTIENIGNSPATIAAGNFNQDGIPDLVVGTTNGVMFLAGTGNGSFAEAQTVLSGKKVQSGQLYVNSGDFNGDGITDVVVSPFGNRASKIVILFGSASKPLQQKLKLTAGNNPLQVVTGNIDGNHQTDLIVFNRQPQQVTVVLNV
ncbi:MAG: VCBS repeat-containing protein [Acidobacteria bacterium]|nr:VCBS repeat-containing protein [Acidobacteriota bacterium]